MRPRKNVACRSRASSSSPACFQTLQPELADRLQHREARRHASASCAAPPGSARPAYRGGEHVGERQAAARLPRPPGSSRRRRPPGDGRAPAPQDEEGIAPGDGGVDRLVAGRHIARSVDQDLQPLAEQGQHCCQRKDVGCGPRPARWPRATRPTADRARPRPGVVVGQGEGRIDGVGPLREQLHGRAAATASRCAAPGSGSAQRGDGQALLTLEVQRGTAGGQHLQRRDSAASSAEHQVRHGGQQCSQLSSSSKL